MSGAVQDIGNVAKSVIGDVSQGAYEQPYQGQLLSNLSSAGGDLWKYLSAPAATSPTDANNQPSTPFGNLIRNISGPAGLAYGIYNAYQQQQVQDRLMNQKWQPLTPQMQSQALQTVEGQMGPQIGSGGRIQEATGLANADFSIENALQQNNLYSLANAARMFPTYGGLGDIFAAMYGTPQTGPYAKATANSLAGTDTSSPDQIADAQFFNEPYYGMSRMSY